MQQALLARLDLKIAYGCSDLHRIVLDRPWNLLQACRTERPVANEQRPAVGEAIVCDISSKVWRIFVANSLTSHLKGRPMV